MAVPYSRKIKRLKDPLGTVSLKDTTFLGDQNGYTTFLGAFSKSLPGALLGRFQRFTSLGRNSVALALAANFSFCSSTRLHIYARRSLAVLLPFLTRKPLKTAHRNWLYAIHLQNMVSGASRASNCPFYCYM